MKGIIKLFLNPIRLILGGLVYVIFKKNTNFGYQGIVGTFCNTHGVSSRLIHRIIMFFKKPYVFDEPIYGVVGQFNKEQIVDIANEIEKNGYYVFEHGLSSETCDALLKFATETEAVVRPFENFENQIAGINKLEKKIIDRQKPVAIRYDFLVKDLVKNEEVQKLLADISIMAVAQEYLKCKPKSDVLGMWWHTSFFKDENSDAATMYHFDMDRVKWLKFFFYLTDTKKENGAHQFIKGSHNGNIPRQFMKQGYARLKASDVIDHYGRDNEVTYEAPRGTIIAEDTSGLHRGNPVQKGDRLLFQIQFSDSLFGAESKTTKIDTNSVHSSLKYMMEKYPDVYELYLTDSFQYKG